jgi:hypothetical protein
MADDGQSADDPWLTLAEIAAELRLSPATIRSAEKVLCACPRRHGSAGVRHGQTRSGDWRWRFARCGVPHYPPSTR